MCDCCHLKMKHIEIHKNGFVMRAVQCSNCQEKIIHPQDIQEYQQFSNLQNKNFRVKLRIVGNSYAVSIPKEIVHFMQDQERMMDDMVRLFFEDTRKLVLNFSGEDEEKEEEKKRFRVRIKDEEKDEEE